MQITLQYVLFATETVSSPDLEVPKADPMQFPLYNDVKAMLQETSFMQKGKYPQLGYWQLLTLFRGHIRISLSTQLLAYQLRRRE